MKRRSKLSIQVYRAITVTAIGLMIGAAPMRVMTVQAQETEKNQEQQSYDQKLDYKVFEDSSERLLEWSDIYMLSNEDIRIAKMRYMRVMDGALQVQICSLILIRWHGTMGQFSLKILILDA